MLNPDLTLKSASGLDQTFKQNKTSGYRIERLDGSTTLALPSMLVIDHTTTKAKTGSPTDRHLIQVATMVSDGNGGKVPVIVNLTISVPRDAVNGSLVAENGVANIASLLLSEGTPTAAFGGILTNQS